MSDAIRVLVSGSGKMGRTILDGLEAAPGIEPVGCVDGLAQGTSIVLGSGRELPLASDPAAACDAVKALGLTRVGLFGTRFTVQGRFYPDVFARERIEVVPPTAADQAFIHDKYMNELLNNLFAPSTRDRLLNVVHVMHTEQRVQAVILAGTELPLLLTDPAAAAVPLLDTTVIHVDAAIERLNAL